jgi:hypothetical protein
MTAMDEGIAIMDPTREAIIYSDAHGPLYGITAMTMATAGINEDFKQNFVLDQFIRAIPCSVEKNHI